MTSEFQHTTSEPIPTILTLSPDNEILFGRPARDAGRKGHSTIDNFKLNLGEFQSDELRKLRDVVAREHKFRVTGHRFIISGVCDVCAKASRRRRRPVDLI